MRSKGPTHRCAAPTPAQRPAVWCLKDGLLGHLDDCGARTPTHEDHPHGEATRHLAKQADKGGIPEKQKANACILLTRSKPELLLNDHEMTTSVQDNF